MLLFTLAVLLAGAALLDGDAVDEAAAGAVDDAAAVLLAEDALLL